MSNEFVIEIKIYFEETTRFPISKGIILDDGLFSAKDFSSFVQKTGRKIAEKLGKTFKEVAYGGCYNRKNLFLGDGDLLPYVRGTE